MASICLPVVELTRRMRRSPAVAFVLEKALSHGLKPGVVVNKIDKPNARPDDVVNEVFDLLGSLNAPDEALDFPVIYASAKNGWATMDLEEVSNRNQIKNG